MITRVRARQAHLYHREGSAIGSQGWQRPASPFSDFHLFKSRITYMRKHQRVFLPLCYLACIKDLCKRLAKGQVANAVAVARALLPKAQAPCQ